QNSLAKDQPDSVDKVIEFQRKESELKRLMEDAIILAQKVVDGKINKQNYGECDEANAAKREKLGLEIESIQETL
ncbi:hypothetical protein, partial [Salmonella sp. s51933]|uniref:hypothetical protein n=1 Tax=Salmonella sp. s51933 TaxID=3160127 RepID=UPI003754B7FA